MIEGFITTKEAAQKLNVSEGRIRQLVADGRLPAVKVGQTNLVKEIDLEAVRERKRTGRPKKADGRAKKTQKLRLTPIQLD